MTENESIWAERVDDWRKSGRTAPDFCKGKGFSPGGLRYWASRLRKPAETAPREQAAPVAPSPPPAEVRLARVARAAPQRESTETPIVIEIGNARLGVKRGFDAEALRAVLEVLGGSR